MAAAAGLVPRLVSPHVLRHAFASTFCTTAPICASCKRCSATRYLDHADYTHVVEERLKSLVRDLHPLAEN